MILQYSEKGLKMLIVSNRDNMLRNIKFLKIKNEQNKIKFVI